MGPFSSYGFEHPPNQALTNQNAIDTISKDFQIDSQSYDFNYDELTVQETYNLIHADEDFVLIDVRSTSEYTTSHIENAISIPLSEFTCESCIDNMLNTYKTSKIIKVINFHDFINLFFVNPF